MALRWKPVQGYEDSYIVSNNGRVISLKGWAKELKASPGVRGYKQVLLQVNNNKQTVPVHKLVYEAFRGPVKKGMQIDHRDNDKLNNNIVNLREVSCQENQWNRKPSTKAKSKYKGVSYYSYGDKWFARIYFDGKRERLGYYPSPELAARAYNKRAKEVFGEFAYQNKIK